jgi:hypothetical protein
MDEMLKIGLYLNDLNRFDGSAEMLGKYKMYYFQF